MLHKPLHDAVANLSMPIRSNHFSTRVLQSTFFKRLQKLSQDVVTNCSRVRRPNQCSTTARPSAVPRRLQKPLHDVVTNCLRVRRPNQCSTTARPSAVPRMLQNPSQDVVTSCAGVNNALQPAACVMKSVPELRGEEMCQPRTGQFVPSVFNHVQRAVVETVRGAGRHRHAMLRTKRHDVGVIP